MGGFFYFMNAKKFSSIKTWSADDRPREKLEKKGVRALSNTELLAILLRTGTTKATALDVAADLLKKANDNLNNLAQFDILKLKDVPGIGPTKAITIIAALELGNRRNLEEAIKLPQFTDSKGVFAFFRSIMTDFTYEEAWYLTLNRANKLKGYYHLSTGGQTGTVIDHRRILRQALYDEATGIILAHNHPSGTLKPSEQDIHITQKLKEACKILDINLLDHLIVSQTSYYSFADEGIL